MGSRDARGLTTIGTINNDRAEEICILTPIREARGRLWKSLPARVDRTTRKGRTYHQVSYSIVATPFGEVRIGLRMTCKGVHAGPSMAIPVISVSGSPWRGLGTWRNRRTTLSDAAEWASVCDTLEDLHQLDIGPVVDEINT